MKWFSESQVVSDWTRKPVVDEWIQKGINCMVTDENWILGGEHAAVYVVVYSLSRVWLFCNSMECSLPGFSAHWIFQARILEWFVITFSRGSSQPRDWIRMHLLHWQVDSLSLSHQREALRTVFFWGKKSLLTFLNNYYCYLMEARFLPLLCNLCRVHNFPF